MRLFHQHSGPDLTHRASQHVFLTIISLKILIVTEWLSMYQKKWYVKRFVVGFISDIWAKLWGHLWKCQQSSLSSVFSISELLPELFRDVLLGKTSQEMHMLCNHYSFLNHKLVRSVGSGLLLVCSMFTLRPLIL